MLKPLIYWTLVLLYAGVIFYLSSIPITLMFDIPGDDKVYHMVEYAILSFLLYQALNSSFENKHRGKIVLLAILLTILYGISDEFHQSFVPTRSSDIYDVVANASGSIIMQGLIYIKGRFFV